MSAFQSRFRRLVFAWALLLAVCAAATVAVALAVDEEYERQKKQIAPDDIDGHFKLALWCKEQKAWALLRAQCTHILRQNPNHEQAQLLLQLANTQLAKQEPGGPAGESPAPGETESSEFARVITDDEIQVLRRAELSRRFPERVTVKFLNDVVNRFAADWFGENRAARVEFMRLPAPEKARFILSQEETEIIAQRYAKDILINTDPRLFADFERDVLPVITRGCATARCHGGPNAAGFRLFTGRRLSKNEIYTNYLILNEYEGGPQGKWKLIDRDNRGLSLLVFYGQRDPVYNELSPAPHPVKIEPIYRNPRDPKYRRVAQWIASLDVVSPEYGIDIRPERQSE